MKNVGTLMRVAPWAVCLGSVLLAAPTARANDASFGGTATDLVPMKETRVEMRSEDISLSYEGDWRIEASYEFYNTSPGAVQLQVGFPEFRCRRGPDCNEVAFKDLRTEVNGVAVEQRQGELTKDHGFSDFLGVIWLFDVEFPSQKVVRIRHSYRIASGGNNYWDRFTSYVTQTGALWSGKIGRARFVARLPAWAHSVNSLHSIELKSIRSVEPEQGLPYTEVVYEQLNWEPKGDLFFSFNGSAEFAMKRLPKDAHQKAGFSEDDVCPGLPPDLESMSQRQRQGCVNLIYATYGYPFERKELKKYFYAGSDEWQLGPHPWDDQGQWWTRGLRPFAAFERSWIGFPDDQFLRMFEEAGDKLPDAAGSKPAPSSQPVAPTPTAAPRPAATPEVDVQVPERGRCNCRVGAQPRSFNGGWALMAWAALWHSRQRRSASARA